MDLQNEANLLPEFSFDIAFSANATLKYLSTTENRDKRRLWKNVKAMVIFIVSPLLQYFSPLHMVKSFILKILESVKQNVYSGVCLKICSFPVELSSLLK